MLFRSRGVKRERNMMQRSSNVEVMGDLVGVNAATTVEGKAASSWRVQYWDERRMYAVEEKWDCRK